MMKLIYSHIYYYLPPFLPRIARCTPWRTLAHRAGNERDRASPMAQLTPDMQFLNPLFVLA